MPRSFKLHDPGEGIHEAEILDISVKEGARVEEGQEVITIETDKASVELPSPFSGTVEQILVATGDQVRVGDVLMTFSDSEEDGQEAEEPERPAAEDDRPPIPAAPATRQLARDLGVDLRRVTATGPHGQVLDEDVRGQAAAARARRGEGAGEPVRGDEVRRLRPARGDGAPAPKLPDFARWGPVDRVALRSVRRATAEHMAQAWAEIPHVVHEDIADITELERFRRKHQQQVREQGGKLTLTVLLLKAMVGVLKQFPRFNASLDVESGEIVKKHYFNIGVAVATDNGLLVPVIKDVDRKNLIELATELETMADRARTGKIGLSDLRGGTFSITNPGPLGGTRLSPIVNYPEVAILGLARARLEPVAEGDLDEAVVTTRYRLPLCLAFDHRVNDGADAARFVSSIVDSLRDVESLIMHL